MASVVKAGWLIVVLLLVACSTPEPPTVTLTGNTMGSQWSVTLLPPLGVALSEKHSAALRQGIQVQFERVDQQMSTWKPNSDISRFNRAPANTWQSVPSELFAVLQRALVLAEQTRGAFDPTVGALVNLWGFGAQGGAHQPPDEQAIQQALNRVGWQKIRLDKDKQAVYQPGGVQLDLSAIAKGFAVDQASEWLLDQGVEHFLVNLSGELRASGHNARQQPWHVAVEKPDAAVAQATSQDVTPYVLRLSNQSVATSGDYRHRFEHDGQQYSHHLDARTGLPVPYEVASVTVVADQCVVADPLGTTLTVMGADAGMAWARQHDLAVMMLVRRADGELVQRMTPAFERLLEQ